MMFLRVGNWLLGVGVMIVLAYHWAGYLAQLHDNQFWFVNIKVSVHQAFLVAPSLELIWLFEGKIKLL